MDRSLPIDPAAPFGRAAGQVAAGSLPASITVRGSLSTEEVVGPTRAPSVGIVGSRAATIHGLDFANELGERLAGAGWIVVSGGALGIDAAAHEGALRAGGRTIAVLGTGIDVVYPQRHQELFARIARQGALMSALRADATPMPSYFPARNPIIAALADVVVVVEAGARSGALGTAAAAVRLTRPLYARPGTAGCDRLIAGGQARAAVRSDELAARLLGGQVAAPVAEADPLLAALLRPRLAEELAPVLETPLAELLARLCELELSGSVLRLNDGRYLAIPGTADLKE
jgi:DNA processing protein